MGGNRLNIHEASFSLTETPSCSIARRLWLEKGEITKYISPICSLRELFVIQMIDDVSSALPWIPTVEDLTASDWFLMYPIKDGSKKRWRIKGLL